MNATADVRARPAVAVPALAIPVALYGIALLVRVVATFVVTFPLSEGSAYYVAVARNIVAGRGLVVDALWSYATPPLELPRAAFELWQPLASSLAALPMFVLGSSYSSAQLGFAVVGAMVAPLTWLVARDAATRLELPEHRQRYVALGAGAVAAVAGPLVLSAALPDSTLPFTVLAVAACVAMPAAIRAEKLAIFALGMLLGLAYLTRMEAVYLGVVFVAFVWTSGARGRNLVGRVGAVAVIGALVALPWWLRNLATFGTPMPGQLADNAFLTSNEQIFAFADRPTLAAFLAQGPATIVAHVAQGLWHDLFDVLLMPGNIVTAVALITIAFGWRRRHAVAGSPLAALLVYGLICFALTSTIFPVATQWGTFEHAAGPLMVAFVVLAALGGDALVARVRAWRRWPRPNAGMAPAAITAVVAAMTVLQLLFAGAQASTRDAQITAVTAASLGTVDRDLTWTPFVTDRPVWLSDSFHLPALVLPRGSAAEVNRVLETFRARYVVRVDASASPALDASPCFVRLPIAPPPEAPELTVFQSTGGCQ